MLKHTIMLKYNAIAVDNTEPELVGLLSKNFTKLTRVTVKPSIQRLTSLPVMLIFTSAGLIVLAASVILMTVESLISPLLSLVQSSQTEIRKKSLAQAQLTSKEAQLCSRIF